MSHKLVILSQRPDDQAFAAEVAVTAGLSLESAETAEDAVAVMETEEAPIIFVDVTTKEMYQAFEEAIQNKLGLFSDKVVSNRIHFISTEDLNRMQFLTSSPLFGHFFLRNYGDVKESGAHYGRVVRASTTGRLFSLKEMLGDDVTVQTVKLARTNQKHDAVEAVKNFMIQAKFKGRMASVIANAVDELLMNAMFDAPVDPIGKPLFSSTTRDTQRDLKDKEEVEMLVAFDGKFVAITAVDQFGSLEKTRLLTHVAKVYTDEEYKVRTTYAGAGIGLANVFRSGGGLLFVSEANTRTEVTVFFKRTTSFKDFKDQFRFVSTQFFF